MIVLGLDLETTGLDTNQCEIIEIGAVLWDWEAKRPLRVLSELIKCELPVPENITEITGIKQEDLDRWGISLRDGLERLKDIARDAEFIVAHNGTFFDRPVIERAWSLNEDLELAQEWIDTMTDLPFAASIQTRKLSYLAAEYGFINPFSHRSLFDVLTMLRIASQFSSEEVVRLQQSPVLRLVAQVSYDDRELAKNQGFRWDPKQRHWFLEAKECQLEAREFPFPTMTL